MASAEAPAVAERVALATPKCSSSAAGHASLVSFARSQSASSFTHVFGAPSRLGADNNASPTTSEFPAPPPDRVFDFERAAAAASNAEKSSKAQTDEKKDAGKERELSPKRRQRRSVPKRMREPLSVDALTGLFEDLRGPAEASVDAGSVDNEAVLAQRLAALDVQKRRRKCADVEVNTEGDAEKTAVVENATAERLAPATEEDVDPDGLANELCFLVDQCDIKTQEKKTGFMPYIV